MDRPLIDLSDNEDFSGSEEDSVSVASSSSSHRLAPPVATQTTFRPPTYFPPPPAPVMLHIKLPEFWIDAPVAWYGAAEAQFLARGVTSELAKFCAVASALTRESAKPVSHLLATPDPVRPYEALKEAMLASHELTPFQKMERLMATPALGGRTPTQLLHDMLELCPTPELMGKEFFAYFFLQRLPSELRVLLAHEDHSDLRRLAAMADHKLSYSSQQSTVTSVVAAVPQQDGVNAVGKGSGK